MAGFFVRWIVNIAALLVVAHVVSGIALDNFTTTITAALVLGLVNVFLRPLVILLTLPLSILSLGLFTLVINGLMFLFVSKLVRGFSVMDFWSAFWGAIIFSIVSFLLNLFITPQGRFGVNTYQYRYAKRNSPRSDDIIDIEAEEDSQRKIE